MAKSGNIAEREPHVGEIWKHWRTRRKGLAVFVDTDRLSRSLSIMMVIMRFEERVVEAGGAGGAGEAGGAGGAGGASGAGGAGGAVGAPNSNLKLTPGSPPPARPHWI